MVLVGRAFGRWLGHEDSLGLVHLQRISQRDPWAMWGVGSYQMPDLLLPWFWTSQPWELWEIKFLLFLSYPVYGILVITTQKIKTPSYIPCITQIWEYSLLLATGRSSIAEWLKASALEMDCMADIWHHSSESLDNTLSTPWILFIILILLYIILTQFPHNLLDRRKSVSFPGVNIINLNLYCAFKQFTYI